jgi:GNAT superfamily N-acetyltransferase
MPEWEVRRLDEKHDRSDFDCGQPMLNEWLRSMAGQFDRRDLARTFVAARPGANVVLGYYSLSSHRVIHHTLPAEAAKGLPKLDVPVVLLGRLAMDQRVQGQGLGAHLLVDALGRALHISREIGVRAVAVDAIDDSARQFYQKFGFRSLLDDRHHLFMPIHEIRKLGLSAK